MLDPRIYRAGLVAVALAVVVFAFSLYDEQGSLGTNLAPDAFNGGNAYATMTSLAGAYPHRPPGSRADQAIADIVARRLRGDGFSVSRSFFGARTIAGTRTLQNVIAVRQGLSAGSILVVAHRDAVGSPAAADLSGTGVLLELARALSGETQHRTVVLASTSGSVGGAGTRQLARSLGRGLDAVIVLGDLAGTRLRGPLVVPWSNSQNLAPELLRNTVATALSSQATLSAGGASIGAQIAHLAFPMVASESGAFGGQGDAAVLLSGSGERAPAPDEPTSLAQITALGRTTLQSISALDGSPSVPRPSAYLLYDGKVIPAWAFRLLVLALILPVLMATIDGVARARRREHSILRWLTWALSAAVPFLLALIVVMLARGVGLLTAAPPGPVSAGAVPLHGKDTVVLVAVLCVIALGYLVLRPLLIRLVNARVGAGQPYGPGAGASVLALLCAASLAIWIADPFAAVLLIPALHLWMWVVEPNVRLRTSVMAALLIAGLALPVLIVVYWALTLGLDPLGAVWNGILLVAGGGVGGLAAVEWSVVFGCAVSAVVIAARAARQAHSEHVPITVRGPAGYAGPGSLGGTESALRR